MFNMFKIISLFVFINFVVLSTAQECNPRVVEWFPHQYSCQKYIICFHGNPIEFSCAPGLHWSVSDEKCNFPLEAGCDIDYLCPADDDPANPILLPDRFDCQNYFVCFNGSPIRRSCAEGLWWDFEANWCTTGDLVTCDPRTENNPGNPSTTEATTIATEPPVLSSCYAISHLFDADNGDYMKSYCIFERLVDYEQAEEACRDSNMNLFVIEHSAMQSAFLTATTNDLVLQNNGYVWINGRKESNDEWFTFNPNRAPLYDGIDWVHTESIDGRVSGDCLRYSSAHGPYQAMGIACNSQSWFTCEFHDDEPVAPTIPTPPTEPPVLSSCYAISHLFNTENGEYMKSYCIINRIIDYEQAEETCRDSNMNLFVIENSIMQSAFLTSSTNDLAAHVNGFVWINGRKESNDEWFTFNPNRAPLYTGVDWVQTENIDGRVSGDCLRYSSEHGPYQAIGVACNTQSWFTCEFHDNEPIATTTVATPPTESPILSSCYAISHLLNTENGDYLKSYCIFDIRPSGYEQAEETCRDNNMNLFVIENSAMQSAFFNATTSDLEDYANGGVLWINGRNEGIDEWFTFNPNRAPLYNGIDWVQTETVDGRVSGDCLMYSSENGYYQAMGADCNRAHWCTCEFHHDQPLNPLAEKLVKGLNGYKLSL